MGKKYSKEETEVKVREALDDHNNLYGAGCVNWRGTLKGSDVTYTDYISKLLLDDIDSFQDKIDKVDRPGKNKSYYVESHHNKNGAQTSETNRVEENIAKKMFNHSNKYGKGDPIIGKILDYQIPLKGTENDKAGKIDLISYNEKTNELFLLELKKSDSKETMLRAALEAYTYRKQVYDEELLIDYKLPIETKIVVAPFVYKDSFAHVQYEVEKEKNLGKLMEKLEIVPYFIEELECSKGDDYEYKVDKEFKLNFIDDPRYSYIRELSNLSEGLGRKGSKYWMGMTVNTRMKDVLDDEMQEDIKWLSPLREDNYKEYRMNHKDCIAKVQKYIPNIVELDKKIWNKNGPLWDGIGISKDKKTLYLVEAKAHINEVICKCAAKGPEVGGNVDNIKNSLKVTYDSMGCKGDFDLWTHKYYQLANRLTYVKELNKVVDINVKLILLNFTDDYTNKPTEENDFVNGFEKVQIDMFGDKDKLYNDPDVEIIYFSVIPK